MRVAYNHMFRTIHTPRYPLQNVTIAVVQDSGAQTFQKCKRHLTLLGVRILTRNKFHSEGPKLLGVTVQNLVSRPTPRYRFVHHWA